MATANETEKTPLSLDDLRQAVDDLYDCRDLFFERHTLQEASTRDSIVEQKMKDTLSLLEGLEDDKHKAQKCYLEGKTRNVMPAASQLAEQLLERAVKLDPTLTDAWNQLGECYWKRGKPSEARNCFLGALQKEKNKVSLRNLSIVLRSLQQGKQEHTERVQESLERAKEAVSLDIVDGQSWAVLGNAYMSSFFSCAQDWEMITNALAAYSNAEKDKRFTGEYVKALEGLQMAAQLDPTWSSPTREAAQLTTYLREFQTLIETKGKLKAKQLEKHLEKLRQKAPKASTLSSLEETKEGSLSLVVVGFTTNSSLAMSLVGVDKEGASVGVALYNMADGKGPLIGDLLQIPAAKPTRVYVAQCGISFVCISVRDPSGLEVNGRSFPRAYLSPTAFTVTSAQT